MPTSGLLAPCPPRRGTKGRAPWGTISRADIIDTALRLGRGQGFQQMTIRSLAAELGVSPMSLYRHITDKDDLLDDVVEELLRRSWRPTAPSGDWRSWVTEAADALRRLLVREPAALYVYQRRPVVSPTAIKRMQAMLQVLRGAGLDEEAAHHAYAAVHTYTLGFCRVGIVPQSGSRAGSVKRPSSPASDIRDSPAVRRGPSLPAGRRRAGRLGRERPSLVVYAEKVRPA